MHNRSRFIGVSAGVIALSAGLASAQLHDGERTVFLESSGDDWGAPMNVAYDPGLDLYYTGGGGFPSNTATVNNPDGTILHATTVEADLRSWFYNPATGDLETVTNNCLNGNGTDTGFFYMGRSGGNLDGSRNLILASMPGLADTQTMPAYNESADVLYSGTIGSFDINQVRRSDGALVQTITCTGATGSNGTYSVGYDPDEDWIILFDSNNSGVMVFEAATGNYVGFAATDLSTSGYGFGYANKQVWVYDGQRNGWQGYDIGAGGRFDLAINMPNGCPGPITVSWTGSPGSGQQALVVGNNLGSTTIPNNQPCSGTLLGVSGGVQMVSPPGLFSNQGGAGSINGNVNSAGVCGRYLQLVKGGTCDVSDVEPIN